MVYQSSRLSIHSFVNTFVGSIFACLLSVRLSTNSVFAQVRVPRAVDVCVSQHYFPFIYFCFLPSFSSSLFFLLFPFSTFSSFNVWIHFCVYFSVLSLLFIVCASISSYLVFRLAIPPSSSILSVISFPVYAPWISEVYLNYMSLRTFVNKLFTKRNKVSDQVQILFKQSSLSWCDVYSLQEIRWTWNR